MKSLSSALLVAAMSSIAVSGPVRAAMVHDTEVHLLPAPKCAAEVYPTYTQGTSYVDVHGSKTFPQGASTDPYYPWPSLRGVSPYNVLIGAPGAPSEAYYIFDKPLHSISLVYGTPDSPDHLRGYDAAGMLVFEFSGAEFNAHFHKTMPPGRVSYNIEIVPSAPIVELELSTRSDALEYALDSDCRR